MSFNGSGTFVVNSAGQPVVANTVISATVFNALTADLATGLSTCITKDGQTTVTANIPFGNNKITALGAGTAASDAANLGQVQSTAAKLVTVTGTDTITGTMSPALTAYAAGQLFYFIANAANTGAVTINIDGLGAKSITRDGSTALTGGDINSGEVVVVVYDGTRFQMINAANSFGNTTINGTLTVTGNTALQANVSITSTLSVGGTFAVTGAATLGSTLAVTGKSDLPTVSTASINAAVALITTGTVTNLTASGASIASANIGNLQFTAASIASINAGVAVVTNLTATSASIASMNAGVALLTTATVTSLTATGASVASANVGTAVVTGLTVTGASIASVNAGVAVLSGNLTLNGGTANGVLYLNGSKVATSGSALYFDGTNLGVGTTSPTAVDGNTNTKLTVGDGSTNDGALGAVTVQRKATSTNQGLGIFQFANTQISATEKRIAFIQGATGSATNSGTLSFWTANAGTLAEAGRFDSSGNLGIGTTSPGKNLEVAAATDTTIRIRNTTTSFGNAVYGTLDWATSDVSAPGGIVAKIDCFDEDIYGDRGALRFFTNNSVSLGERARITAAGDVGIGTTSPDTRLQVTYDSSDTSQFNNAASALMLTNTNTTNNNWAQIFFTDSDGGAAAATFGVQYTDHTNNYGNLSFATRGTSGLGERARITAGGYLKASNDGTYDGATAARYEFKQTADNINLLLDCTNGSYTESILVPRAERAASNAYEFLVAQSGPGAADNEFMLRGDGNGYADGTWNNNGADYAEFFESATGGALTVGATVVLDGNKVREATASDLASAIMGVVRPKEPSKASMVVGNTAWNKWANKYLTDDFDRYIMEDHDVVEWTDENGKQHSYESHHIPSDVTVPADAVRKTHDDKGNKFQHYKLNPAWDKNADYIPREKRDEWIIVGLVGQVKVLKGQPVNDRWIKMRDVSATVEEWMIR